MGVNEQAWKVGFKWTKGDESNNAGAIAVDTTSKALHIADIADITTDWNVAVDSHPSLYIHSATTPATDYLKMWHDATDAYLNAAAATTLYFQIAGTTEMELAAAALTLSAPLTVGVNDTGYDVNLFGATSGCKALWDESEDQLVLTQTNAATTGVERTLDVSQTHTGIGASAEATRSVITTNVAGGTYMNALFGKIDFQTAGKVTGLAGVICGELTMAGGTVSQGTYCVFEAEINLPTSYSSSVTIPIIRAEVWGAQKATFDTTGYLFEIVGCSSTSGGFWYDSTSNAADEFVRVKTPSGDRFIALSDSGTTWA